MVYALPVIRTKHRWLDKAFALVFVLQAIAVYYGIVILAFTMVPFFAELALLAVLVILDLLFNGFLLKIPKTFLKLQISPACILAKDTPPRFVEFARNKRDSLKSLLSGSQNIGICFKKRIFFFFAKLKISRRDYILWILFFVHAIALLGIHFFILAHLEWQGADIIYGRRGSRSYIFNDFTYLPWTLILLAGLTSAEAAVLWLFGIVKEKLRLKLFYLVIIVFLAGLTLASNIPLVAHRDQWLHVGGAYNLVKNNEYTVSYLGRDISRETTEHGVPARFIVGTQTSYVSNYGFYYFFAKLLGINSLPSFISLYRILHPLWWSFSVVFALYFLLKRIGIDSPSQRVFVMLAGLLSVGALTMANRNFPQYSSLPVFFLALEHLFFVLKNRKQAVLLIALVFMLLFSYASYALLFFALIPLAYALAKKKKLLVAPASVVSVSVLFAFNYFLGNFTKQFNYEWKGVFACVFDSALNIARAAFSGNYFFNMEFIEKLYAGFWPSVASFAVLIILAVLVAKTGKLKALHAITAVLVLAYALATTMSAGENLVIARLQPLIWLMIALCFGYALSRVKFRGSAVALFVFVFLSVMSFINVVHATHTRMFSLLTEFNEKYGFAEKDFCFVADEPEIWALEAVSAQKIRGGNFKYSDDHFTKEDLFSIRDRLVFHNDKQPLEEYQKKHALLTCYILNPLTNEKDFTNLFGEPVLLNQSFAIWENSL